ncbi:unnamed protein product [Trichobilharzia regenti]|nr:unnamed protein product [Trichobilharzia regenti]
MSAYAYPLFTLMLYILICTIKMKFTIIEAKNCPPTEITSSSQRSLNSKLKCLRLFTEQSQDGDWFDICDSNELLSSLFIWKIQSACAPASGSSGKQRYWLLYDQMILTHMLLIVLTGFAVSTLQTAINTTEKYISTTEEYSDSSETYANTTTKAPHNDSLTAHPNSHLLQGLYLQLQCLRLYSEANRRGYWSDMCDSNEALSPLQVWNTRSLCSPGYQLHGRSSYWLIYEQPHFTGPYILLGPDRCVDNVYKYKLISISSILTCTQNLQTSPYPTVNCHYPKQPWRQLQSLMQHTKDSKDKSQDGVSKGKICFQVKGEIHATLRKTQNLTDLLRESVNNK